MKKKDYSKVKSIRRVSHDELISILNQVECSFPDSYPVITRSVSEEGDDFDELEVNIAGIDKDNCFILNDVDCGTLLKIHEEIWMSDRVEEIFHMCYGGREFDILEGSFTGKLVNYITPY